MCQICSYTLHSKRSPPPKHKHLASYVQVLLEMRTATCEGVHVKCPPLPRYSTLTNTATSQQFSENMWTPGLCGSIHNTAIVSRITPRPFYTTSFQNHDNNITGYHPIPNYICIWYSATNYSYKPVYVRLPGRFASANTSARRRPK
jgi:hypothetical protein